MYLEWATNLEPAYVNKHIKKSYILLPNINVFIFFQAGDFIIKYMNI